MARSTVRAVCGVQPKDWKRAKDWMLSISEAVDLLPNISSPCLCVHVLRGRSSFIEQSINSFSEGKQRN